MATQLGGATSGCLSSPRGRSACTNKPTPGLRSNGNQTCSRTKSLLSLLPSSSPPPPLLLLLSLEDQRSADTHSSWRTHFNYPKQTWKYSPFLFPLQRSHTAAGLMTSHVSTSALTSLTLELPDSSDLPFISSDTLSLTLTCFLYHSSSLPTFSQLLSELHWTLEILRIFSGGPVCVNVNVWVRVSGQSQQFIRPAPSIKSAMRIQQGILRTIIRDRVGVLMMFRTCNR